MQQESNPLFYCFSLQCLFLLVFVSYCTLPHNNIASCLTNSGVGDYDAVLFARKSRTVQASDPYLSVSQSLFCCSQLVVQGINHCNNFAAISAREKTNSFCLFFFVCIVSHWSHARCSCIVMGFCMELFCKICTNG